MSDTSGRDGFDHFALTRFVADDCRVKLLPDPMGGQFAVGMTPEQAEFLIRHLTGLAAAARKNRGRKYPTLYPEDAMSEVKAEEQPATWAIVELMGHVKLAGKLSEVERFGSKLGRLDIPTEECSGPTDNWCPKCGRCSCPKPDESRDDPACPLHSPTSRHGEEPKFITQFFGGGSAYRITFVSEPVARDVAKATRPAPVQPWDYPKQLAQGYAPAAQRPYSDSEITGLDRNDDPDLDDEDD